MSKLYDTYMVLKEQNPKVIYLFKSGIFFIALDEDAKTLSKTFNLKLTNLTPSILKCGFPCSSFEKYSKLFQAYNLEIKLIEIDKKISYSINNYNENKQYIELLNCIKSVDINNLSIGQAYTLLEKLQKIANENI